jgi:hypothetical protein
MQLVINTFGSCLRKKEGNFLVKTDDQTFEVIMQDIPGWCSRRAGSIKTRIETFITGQGPVPPKEKKSRQRNGKTKIEQETN